MAFPESVPRLTHPAIPRKTAPSVIAGRLLPVLLAVVYLIVVLYSLMNSLSWVNRPFPGFLTNARLGLAYAGPSDWTGTRAGLVYPDRILAVNGQAIESSQQLKDLLADLPAGQPVRYTIERQGRVVEAMIETMPFTWADWVVAFGVTFLVGLGYFALGLIVFALKPNTEVSWVFLFCCVLAALFYTISFDTLSTHTTALRYLFLAIIPLLASGLVHLALVFPERVGWADRIPALKGFPYLLAGAFALPLTWLYPQPSGLALYQAAQIYAALGVLSLLVFSLRAARSSESVLARTRSKVVLWGAGVSFPLPALVPIVSFAGLSITKVPTTLFAVPLIFFPAAIGYAIARHNLFDVDVYIKRAVGYAVMTGVVAIGYFAIQTAANTVVLKPLFGAQADALAPVIFAFLVVFFFNPVNRRVQEGVETLFFRKPYDYKGTVASIGDALASLMDLDAILTKVISILRRQMFLDRVGVVVFDPGTQTCRFLLFGETPEPVSRPAGNQTVRPDDPLLSLLGREKRLITKYDIAEDPRYAADRAACSRSFADLGASIAVPLLYQDTFAGMLAVGYKKSGHFYSRDDVDLLKTASAMTATAIEQAREKEQRGTLMQLFSKAVSPEVADALWEQRDQFLDGGRPRSQKQTVTVLFTDLQGFTSVSEKLDAQALMEWLNTYMDAIARTVMDHGGVVDDYFGDGVKVNFGVPVPRTTEEEQRQDATHAVECALALEQEMRRVNATMQARGFPTLRMRVGIYTGPVVAGSLGSADRMKYTTLGDTVNTAARLESFSKELNLSHLADSPCRILIGETTLRHLNDRFLTVRVGELELKGKAEKVAAYCVLGQKANTRSSDAATERNPVI